MIERREFLITGGALAFAASAADRKPRKEELCKPTNTESVLAR